MITEPYDILKKLSSVRDQPPHTIYGLPLYSKRFKFITNWLIDKSIGFTIDNFKGEYSYFNNLYVSVNGLKNKTNLYFMAHHDVVETKFENANDNTASIAILLSLADTFNNIENLDYNLIFVFTDSEERGFIGADRFVDQLEGGMFADFGVKEIINMELCGVGEKLWIENTVRAKYLCDNIPWYNGDNKCIIECPPNDASFIRTMFSIYQEATTIGILNTKAGGELDKSPWNLIHTARDTVDKMNREDMNNLTIALKNLIMT